MWLFSSLTLVVPVTLIFWYLSRKSIQQFEESGSRISQVFRYVFLVPILLVLYVALSSLFQIIWHNW